MTTEELVAEVEDEQVSTKSNFLGLTKKQRKRELKSIDYLLRDLSDDVTAEDKLIILFRKLNTLQAEKDSALTKLKQAEKRTLTISSERDQFHNDFNRLLLQKDKLETLCRELQKQNHQIRDQSISMAKAEDEKRKEVADHFQSSITEIQQQLGDYLEKNSNLRQENQNLADKMQSFIKDHEKREEHVQKVMKTRELEARLAEAKLNQAKIQHEQEVLKIKQEVARLNEEANLAEKRMEAHKNVEERLKEQIDFYKAKYAEFNKTMMKSNNLIEDTKLEMEKMAKHLRLTESQALDFRSKWEVSQRSLLEMVDACKKEKEKSMGLTRQVESLSNLCRALRGGGGGNPISGDAPPNASADASKTSENESLESPKTDS